MNSSLKILLVLIAIIAAWFLLRGPSGGPSAGGSVIDFELKDLSGSTVRTAELRKDKPFVLKFGATWCGWCNKQIPELKRVVSEYGDRVAVLDVDVKESADEVRQHSAKYETTYTTVLDPDGSVAGKYGVRGIPVVLVIDRGGKIVYRGNYTRFSALKKVIDPLLK